MRNQKREVREPSEIFDIISRCTVCRVALSDASAPYIVPMNFGFKADGDALVFYFHCAREGRKLDLIAKDPRCGFELDIPHGYTHAVQTHKCTMRYESVVGAGEIALVTDEAERVEALTLLMRHSGRPGPFDFPPKALAAAAVLRLTARAYTAKRNIK